MNRKVLIVNSKSIYSNDATGITLRSLFEKINQENLMEVYWEKDIENHKINSILLGYSHISLAHILMNIRNSKVNNELKKKSDNKKRCLNFKKFFVYIRQYFALVPDLTDLKISKYDYDRINNFKPDVIYTLGGNINSLKVAYNLSKIFNIPIVIHHMDNWMHSIQWENNPLLISYKNKLRKYCKLCYTRSNLALTISEEMANVFTNEFKIKHYAIMNSIDIKKFKCQPISNYDTTFRVTYAGGLHLKRDKALLDIANVINKLCQEGMKIELNIFTSLDNIQLYKSEFERFQCVNFHKSVSHDLVMNIYQNTDVLVHVESNLLENNEFYKYSISTKIPEYLSTGKPFIFYGPKTIYLYRFLSDNDIAYTASDKIELENFIKKLAKKDLNLEITNRAYHYAEKHFDIKHSLEVLMKVLDEANIPVKEES